MSDPIIRIEGLTKRFGAVAAVDKVDLDVARGELFALLGGSGCGKTTLLRLLAGLLRPATGRVHLQGRPLDSLTRRAIAQQVALVEQHADTAEKVAVATSVVAAYVSKGEVAPKVIALSVPDSVDCIVNTYV